MPWGTTWARPNVHEMHSIVRLVLACGLSTQKAGHARRDEQDSDSTETLSGIRYFGSLSFYGRDKALRCAFGTYIQTPTIHHPIIPSTS
jgi:hypothetical protein